WFVAAAGSAVVIQVLLLMRRFKPLCDRISELEKTQARFAKKAGQYGLVDFFNMQDDEDKKQRNEVNGRIVTRARSIALVCETGNSYFNPELDRHWPEIKAKLEKSEPIRLLMINPNCGAKKFRDEIGMKGRADLARIRELINKYPNLDLKFTDQVYCSIFF